MGRTSHGLREHGGDLCKENASVEYDLQFLKPWKSQAKVQMLTKEHEGGTSVTWTLDSSLPFYLFWMKKQMEAYVGMDYDRGLSLLKDFVEDGELHCKLDFAGEENFEGCDFLGISRECALDEMQKHMGKDFGQLMDYAKNNPEADPSKCFSQYHKWDVVKGRVSYTAGVPVRGDIGNPPSGFSKGKLEATKVNVVQLTGPYHHLGSAWSAQQMMQRSKEFKAKKGYHPFEIYIDSPADTQPNDIRTKVMFPIQ